MLNVFAKSNREAIWITMSGCPNFVVQIASFLAKTFIFFEESTSPAHPFFPGAFFLNKILSL